MITIYPTKEKAEELIKIAKDRNPGPWVEHSYTAAHCAEKIANACKMNSEKAYVLGLLHDIGRHFSIPGFGHIYYGYKYMLDLGYDEVARICMSHSFTTQSEKDYVGALDISDKEYEELKIILAEMVFDDYDRLIQLCDSLSGSVVMDMIDRMNDVERRYGSYSKEKRAKNIGLKTYFEEQAGENIYKLVTDNKELWGK